ncbi:4'-phosphopantetheinyl transferase superfamily protein [Fibrobacter sp. UWB12]|uniref:4'-phosphopantetheinyl transferase family protein n=1 Tax=Fibrobacter sp. UWB12 TaxID=1896203 RepID=UPI000924855B|nr:4'-phosphopantetheinyl transferase superfamily protein [Fibrobacter sp. UWB12]SHK90591.1 4'-phosphopantetheinyl transferase [Fibrobacter sp. UWB12]
MLETTRIYIADISVLKDASVFESFLKKVPEYRQKKAMSFKFEKGKTQSLGVGILLKMACEESGFSGADEHIVYGENGKPFFADFPDVHFNLSHSGERVMCVISPFEVGCDVEIIKGDRGRLAERFFKPEESAWIKHFETLEAQSEAFYRLWTLKECYMKVTGRGMSLMPDMFALHVDENENVSLFHDGVRPEYAFREIDLHDGYRYAYCIKNNGKDAPQEVKRVDLF